MELTEYTAAVNRILKQKCDKLPEDGLFAAVHVDVCDGLTSYYFDFGFSVENAADEIENNVGY
jgi:hypothetical protein